MRGVVGDSVCSVGSDGMWESDSCVVASVVACLLSAAERLNECVALWLSVSVSLYPSVYYCSL